MARHFTACSECAEQRTITATEEHRSDDGIHLQRAYKIYIYFSTDGKGEAYYGGRGEARGVGRAPPNSENLRSNDTSFRRIEI